MALPWQHPVGMSTTLERSGGAEARGVPDLPGDELPAAG